MSKCSFCGSNIERGTGKIFAKNDGSVLYFCSNKCEKNMRVLKRSAKFLKWTESFKKTKEKA